MKKVVVCWLAVVLAFCLAACGAAPSSDNPGSQANIDPQEDLLAFLEAAGEKLKNADSFEMKIWDWSELYQNFESAYSPDLEICIYQMQYVSDFGGTPASFCQITNYRGTPRFSYLHGNSGFSGDLNDGEGLRYDKKHIRDEAFSVSQHFGHIQNGLNIQNSRMFEAFCALKYSVIPGEDKAVTIVFADLTEEQVVSLMDTEHPLYLKEIGFNLYSLRIGCNGNAEAKYTVSFTVDMQGYLSRIQIDRLQKLSKSNDYVIIATRSLAFSRFNEEMEIQKPEYEAIFKCEGEHSTVYHHFGEHHAAWYTYDTEDRAYYFRGTNYMHDEDGDREKYIDAYYKVLSEIDGVLVDSIAFNNYSSDIKGLVVPKSAIIQPFGDGNPGLGYGTLYFEDTRENIKGDFKNTCYFAGEWEYVDGVPTPIGQ